MGLADGLSASPGSNDDTEKMSQYNSHLVKTNTVGEGEVVDLGVHLGTKRNIKSRHAQMIAIGGSIGTGFFLGTGQALAIGGPGFLVIAYTLMSLLVYCIVTAVIEISTYLPVSSASISYYCTRYVSSSLGFALGWLYFYSFGIIVAYELTAASIVIDFWPNDINIAVWITIMIIVIVGLNLCPVGVFAETEFWFAGIKVVMILGMLLLSLIIMLGGAPNHDRLGFRYWKYGAAFNTYIVQGPGRPIYCFSLCLGLRRILLLLWPRIDGIHFWRNAKPTKESSNSLSSLLSTTGGLLCLRYISNRRHLLVQG